MIDRDHAMPPIEQSRLREKMEFIHSSDKKTLKEKWQIQMLNLEMDPTKRKQKFFWAGDSEYTGITVLYQQTPDLSLKEKIELVDFEERYQKIAGMDVLFELYIWQNGVRLLWPTDYKLSRALTNREMKERITALEAEANSDDLKLLKKLKFKQRFSKGELGAKDCAKLDEMVGEALEKYPTGSMMKIKRALENDIKQTEQKINQTYNQSTA